MALAPLYYPTGSGHWLGYLNDGRVVTLEDDSLWEVSPLDRIHSGLWLVTQQITIVRGDQVRYPYKLVNTSRDQLVNARLLSR